MGPKFSIRYKFLAVTTILLAVCVGTYLLLASYIFKEDKRALVFDYNRSLVVNLSSDLENFVRGVSDKMELVAHFHRKRDKSNLQFVQDILANDHDLVWMGSSEGLQKIDRRLYLNEDYQKTYALEKNFFEQILVEGRPIPFDRLRKEGEVFWNATLEADGPALIGVARSVIEENESGVPVNQFAVLAFVRADRLIQSLRESQPIESLVVNDEGEILAHPMPEVLRAGKLEDQSFLNKALKSELRTQVLKYTSEQGDRFGAFSRALGGQLFVLSSVTEASAFRAVNDLVFRSILFGSILITLAFLFAIGFSRSLTRPIETLVGGMNRVAKGDLNTNIKVQTHDEIASLAENFNHMIADLKESRTELANLNSKVLESERTTAVAAVARGVAHEFGNLLMQITGKAEISRNKTPEKMGQALDRILDASLRASEILDRFKHLSENQNEVNPKKKEDIKLIAEEAFDLLEHQFRTKGVEIVPEIESVKAEVHSTPVLQIFVNLMINAGHAMEDQEEAKKIFVTVKDDDLFVQIKIRDTGPGVPDELLEKVTKAFFTTKGDSGTGLGLAICKEIVEIDHQGEFKVSNHAEGGFEISMLIPKKEFKKEEVA